KPQIPPLHRQALPNCSAHSTTGRPRAARHIHPDTPPAWPSGESDASLFLLLPHRSGATNVVMLDLARIGLELALTWPLKLLSTTLIWIPQSKPKIQSTFALKSWPCTVSNKLGNTSPAFPSNT